MQELLKKIYSDEILERAFLWVQERRANYSHNSDIWDLCCHWQEVKPELQAELTAGRYRFSALTEYRFADGNQMVWRAQDAVVPKAIARGFLRNGP